MFIEVAELTVREGAEEEFGTIMRDKAVPLLESLPGAGTARFGRGVEDPSKFAFIVEWDSVEAHNAARAQPAFQEFRTLFGDLTTGGSMIHYDVG